MCLHFFIQNKPFLKLGWGSNFQLFTLRKLSNRLNCSFSFDLKRPAVAFKERDRLGKVVEPKVQYYVKKLLRFLL